MSILKTVKFIKIKARVSGYKLLRGVKYAFENMEDIIIKMTDSGWIYSGFVPLSVRGDGGFDEIELIFIMERKK